MLDPAGSHAGSIAQMIGSSFAVAAGVYIVVVTALFWSMARRKRPSDTLRSRVAAGALGLTVLVLVGLTLAGVTAGRSLEEPAGPPANNVEVTGTPIGRGVYGES